MTSSTLRKGCDMPLNTLWRDPSEYAAYENDNGDQLVQVLCEVVNIDSEGWDHVSIGDHAVGDKFVSIGFVSDDVDMVDGELVPGWLVAGWNMSQDCFTDARGFHVIGWQPLASATSPLSAEGPVDQEVQPCGGCGNAIPEKRCLGCLHDFGTQVSARTELKSPLRESPALEMQNLSDSPIYIKSLKQTRIRRSSGFALPVTMVSSDDETVVCPAPGVLYVLDQDPSLEVVDALFYPVDGDGRLEQPSYPARAVFSFRASSRAVKA